jgi:hypothetical protein
MFEVPPRVSIEAILPTWSKADGQFCSAILLLGAMFLVAFSKFVKH